MKYFGCLALSLLVASCSTTTRNTHSEGDGGAAGAADISSSGGLSSSGGTGTVNYKLSAVPTGNV